MVTHPQFEKEVTTNNYFRVDPGKESLEETRPAVLHLGDDVIHPGDQVHRDEQRLHHYLVTHPKYLFSDLVIHRIPGGVCIEGRLHASPDAPNLEREISRFMGNCRVINHVVLCLEAPDEFDLAKRGEISGCGCAR